MKIYDDAHKLAKQIRESKEYEEYKKFGKKYQMLCSYIIKFNFKSNSGILNYLTNKSFILDKNKFI